MGRLTGLEPATTRITTEGSTAELQSPQFIWHLMPYTPPIRQAKNFIC